MWDDVTHMQALEREVTHLRTLLQSHDTGHIHTAIGVLMNRILEIANTLDLELRHDFIKFSSSMRMPGGDV
jgi:cell division protein FtsL